MRTLPEKVYFKHGAYYFVTPEKQWIRLGKTEEEALARYATIASAPEVLSTMNRVFDKYTLEVVPLKAERTQADNLKEIKNLRPVFGAMRPQDVKPRHIAQYLALRTAKVRANREIALLSHVFKKALNWGVVERNPCLGIERNPEYPRDRYVTDQELELFKKYAPQWLRLYLNLKLLTGLRQGDLLRLKWTDWSPNGLQVQIGKSGRGHKRQGQQRVLFLPSAELQSVLQTLRGLCPDSSENTTMFLTRGSTPMTPSGLDSAWGRVWLRIEKAGLSLPRFREHDVRAKTATDADGIGMDATKLLGHSDKKTTSAYLRGRRVVKLEPLK